ncbi:MAG: Gfo/Idh/MocA family oxidoreductase [Opitutales bacterium]|nr:Gfo/Idh/MocA family oxidoreductase [Opitutales bacterium]
MSEKLKWGMLGTGQIAGEFAHDLTESHTGELVAVASRSLKKAEDFAQKNGNVKAHGSYESLFADPEVDIVYIATPHPMHAEWAVKAAEAGKHILCEKPLAMNVAETQRILTAVRTNKVFMMEAFMYRCHPQTQKLVDCIREGLIGEVKTIRSVFGFRFDWLPEHRLLNKSLGGGGILDLGCYPISFIRLIAGAAQGKGFADPHTFHAVGHMGETGVDEYTTALMQFEGDIVGEAAIGVRLDRGVYCDIYGTEGSIHIPTPWHPAKHKGKWEFQLNRPGKATESIRGETDRSLFAHEADFIAAHIARGEASSPGPSLDDTLGNMRCLDLWKDAIGLHYKG